VPWAEFMAHPNEYFNECDIPAGVTVREPSKMRFQELQSLHNFWLQRQAAGTTTFHFKKVSSRHMKSEVNVAMESMREVNELVLGTSTGYLSLYIL